MGNEGWQSLVLPALTLAAPTSAVIAQALGSSLAGAWAQPFADAIRTKGASQVRLLLTHVLPNAAIPLLPMAGIITGNLLAGSVVTETVFAREHTLAGASPHEADAGTKRFFGCADTRSIGKKAFRERIGLDRHHSRR